MIRWVTRDNIGEGLQYPKRGTTATGALLISCQRISGRRFSYVTVASPAVPRQPDLLGQAKALRALREAKGWSQEKLAIEADMHRTMIGAYERAERKLYIPAAKQILRALEVTWTDFGHELDKYDPIKRGRKR